MIPAFAIVSPLKENQDGKLCYQGPSPTTLTFSSSFFWAVFWTSLYKLRLLLENNHKDQLRSIEFGTGVRSLAPEDKALACVCGQW